MESIMKLQSQPSQLWSARVWEIPEFMVQSTWAPSSRYIGVLMNCMDDTYMYFDLGVMLAWLKQGGTAIDVYRYIGLKNAVIMNGYDWMNDHGLC
jgi:hypothetical protein